MLSRDLVPIPHQSAGAADWQSRHRLRVGTGRRHRPRRVWRSRHHAALNTLAVEAFNDLLKKYGKKSVENPLLD
jgi:hypothetical protein